jgi:hypothetical protein
MNSLGVRFQQKGEIIMSSFRDELASWRIVSRMLDELNTTKNAKECAQPSEFHGKNDLCDAEPLPYHISEFQRETGR